MAINQNRYSRQNAQNVGKRDVTGEERINIDAQLTRLEEDIRRLKIEYDIFFNGGTKRAPFDTKNRVETVFKRLGDERSLSFAQRYQYNSLLARFTAFRELWRRTMKGREEGRDAAAVRAAQQQIETAKLPEKSKFVCSEVEYETDTVAHIYNALIKAKTVCGEKTAELSFEHFERQLKTQTERFKQTAGCQRVLFEVGTENGRVIFKATAEE